MRNVNGREDGSGSSSGSGLVEDEEEDELVGGTLDGGGSTGMMDQSHPHSPRAVQSSLKFAPQAPVAPIQKPDELHILSQSWNHAASPPEDMSCEEGIPTMITWSYGGKDVALEGSWDNWKSRKPLQRSGKDFTLMKVLPSGVYQYRFVVDGAWRYAPDLPWAQDETGNYYNVLDLQVSPMNVKRREIIESSLSSSSSLVSISLAGQTTKSTEEGEGRKKEKIIDLGNGSQVVYNPRFLGYDESWKWFDYLNSRIPWTRPTIRVFGRSCVQPRDTCYVASLGLPELVYSGYQPHAYSWDEYPPLKELLEAVHNALPGSRFNSLLLNRYKGGNDYVGWHSDDEKLYGSTPEIASLSFGCEREFMLKKKPNRQCQGDEPASKRLKKRRHGDQNSFTLKHGSLLVMRGYTQRDWIHSVPKRTKVDAVRINLTFRFVL